MGAQHAIIVAIVTIKPNCVQGGGAPVFVVENQQALQQTAFDLEKVMDAATHEISASTLILVAH